MYAYTQYACTCTCIHTTLKFFYSLQLLTIGQHECAVVAEQVEQTWWLWNVQTHIVPVIKILTPILFRECDGCQLVSLLHEVLVSKEVECSFLMRLNWLNWNGGESEEG